MQTTLTYTIIEAPVSGRIGSIPTKPGSIVRSSDSAPLATVNQVDPALVSFALPQKRLTELREAMAKGPVKVEVTVGKLFRGTGNGPSKKSAEQNAARDLLASMDGQSPE